MSKDFSIPRIEAVLPNEATGQTLLLFEKAEKRMGMIPNLFHHLALSPKALQGFLEQQIALEEGILSAENRESVALRVAEYNRAGYCVSMHNYVGENVAGLSQDQIYAARIGNSKNKKTQAILSLTDKVLEKKGLLSYEELESARTAGITDAEIIETVANISWNIFANYVDGIAEPRADTPQVDLLS
jgi:uncharacterized peroxidase-related enzyme